jgi:fermentation-respiration switch protein FrsA (DUF1100 family)
MLKTLLCHVNRFFSLFSHYLAKLPIKIIHARTDPTVPLGHSEELVAKSNSGNVSLLVVEDNHALTKHSTPDKMKEFISEIIAKLMLNTFCD